MTAELKARGFSCSLNRVARLMQKNGIAAKTKRKFKVTTISKHKFPIAPNLLKQSFTADGPNLVWASDITYIATGEGWLYLAMVKDLHSKKVVGWSMQERLRRDLVIDAFKQAVMQRRPEPGLIFHSDRGIQYACCDFRALLKKHKAVQSMSGKGNCYDNAVSESFFGTLKNELVYATRFPTKDKARVAIFDYIEVFYNRQRRHSALGYLSPAEFESRSFIKCA
jgi:putative transposase